MISLPLIQMAYSVATIVRLFGIATVFRSHWATGLRSNAGVAPPNFHILQRKLTSIDNLNATAAAVELDEPVDEGVEREVGPLADAVARVETVADLADDNVSGSNSLSAEQLYAASLRVRVTSVSAGALSLFVCHEIISPHKWSSAGGWAKRNRYVLLTMGLRQINNCGNTCAAWDSRCCRNGLRRPTTGRFCAVNGPRTSLFSDKPTRSQPLRESRSESLPRFRGIDRRAARS
jgi:hypothetical protein